MINENAKRFTRTIITIFAMTVIASVFFVFFAHAKQSAVDVRKKSDLVQLYKVLSMYYTYEGMAPENPSSNNWCEIGKMYDNKKCLRELNRDGYIGALPISPDNNPYFYHNDKKVFYVAVRLNKELSQKDKCPFTDDSFLWCKIFNK